MISSKALKDIVSEIRPIIERQLDDAERIAAFRELVAGQGGDWSALKALVKAQIQDERDDGKRVEKILMKAEFATGYADMLGWANMNEKNFNSEPAPAPQGEADAPSEQVSPSNADQPDRPTGGIKACSANIGGDHVTETPHFAAIRPGLVSNSPANHPLRPNCKNPGSECAGYGSKLCHACAVAVRELETT